GVSTIVAAPPTGVIVKRNDLSDEAPPKPCPVTDTNISLLPAWIVPTAGLFGWFGVAAEANGATSSPTARILDAEHADMGPPPKACVTGRGSCGQGIEGLRA